MTEEEAKTKWCPFATVGSSRSGLGGFNRDTVDGPMEEARCVGSGCMAWRDLPLAGGGFGHGYCGLAGDPR